MSMKIKNIFRRKNFYLLFCIFFNNIFNFGLVRNSLYQSLTSFFWYIIAVSSWFLLPLILSIVAHGWNVGLKKNNFYFGMCMMFIVSIMCLILSNIN